MSRGRDETGGWDSAKAGAAASSSPKAPPLGGGRRSSLSKAASADDILRTSVSGSPEVSSQGSPNASRNRSMSEGNGRGSTDHSPTTGRRISRDSAFQHRHSLRSSMLGRGGNSPSRKSESEEFDGSDIESSIGYSSLDDLDNSRMQDFVSDPEFKDKDGQMDYKPDALVKSEYTKWVDDNSENKDFEEQFAIYQNKLNIANEQFQVILNGLLQSFEKRLSKATKGIIPGITAGNPKESELGPLKSKKAFKNLMREFAGLDNDSGLVEVALGDLKRGWQNYTVGGSSGYDIMSQVFELYKDYGQLKKYGELKTDAEIKKLQKDSSRNEYPEEKKIDLGGLPPYLVNKFQDYAFRAFKVSVESMRSSRKASLGVKGKGLLGIIREGADLARESYEKFKIENDYLLNHVAKRQVEAVRTYKSVGKSDESLNIAICEPALEPFESKVIPDLKIPGSMHFEGMLLSRDQLEALRDIDRAFANYNGGTESGGLRGKVEIRLPTGTGKSHLSRLLKDIYSTKIEEIGSVDLNSTERDMTRLLRVSKQDLSLSEVRGHNQAGLEHKKAQYVSIDESFFFARYFREKFLPEDLVEKDFKKYDDKDFAALEKGRVEFLRGLRRNGVVAITWGASEEPLKVRFEILRNKDKLLALEKEFYDLKKELDKTKAKEEGSKFRKLFLKLDQAKDKEAKDKEAINIYKFVRPKYLSAEGKTDPVSSFIREVILSMPDVYSNREGLANPDVITKGLEGIRGKYSFLEEKESHNSLDHLTYKEKKARAEKLASEIPRRKSRVKVKEGYHKRLIARHKEVYSVIDNEKTTLRKPVAPPRGAGSFSVDYHIAQIDSVVPSNVSGFAQYITDEDLNILQNDSYALQRICKSRGLDAIVTIFKGDDKSVKYKILESTGKETIVNDSEGLKDYVSEFTEADKKVLSIFDRKNYIGGDYKGFSSNITFQGIDLSDNATENDYTQAIGRDRTPDFSRRRVSDKAFDRIVVSNFGAEELKGQIGRETKKQAFIKTLGYGLAKSGDSKDKYTALRSRIDRLGHRSVYELFAKECGVEGANHETAKSFFDKWEESIKHYQDQYDQGVEDIEDIDNSAEEQFEEQQRLQAETDAAAAVEAEKERKAREQADIDEENLLKRRENDRQAAIAANRRLEQERAAKEAADRQAKLDAAKKAAADARAAAEQAQRELETRQKEQRRQAENEAKARDEENARRTVEKERQERRDAAKKKKQEDEIAKLKQETEDERQRAADLQKEKDDLGSGRGGGAAPDPTEVDDPDATRRAQEEAARKLALDAAKKDAADAKVAADQAQRELEAEAARLAALAAGGKTDPIAPVIPTPSTPPITLTPIASSDLLEKIEKTSEKLHSLSNRNTDRLLRNSKDLQKNGAQRNVAKTLVEIFNMGSVSDRAKKFDNLGHASTMIKFAQEYGFAGGDRKSVKNAELAYKHVLGKDTDILKNLVEVRSGFNEQLNEIVKDRRKGKIESFDFDKYDDKIKKPKSTIKNSVTTKAFNELRGNERSASGGPVSVA